MLRFHFVFISLEQEGAGRELFRLESFNLEHIELLHLINEVLKYTVTSRLESLSELELLVINKSDRSGVLLQLANCLHELNSNFVVGEQNGVEDAYLGKRLDSHDDISDDTDVTFTS